MRSDPNPRRPMLQDDRGSVMVPVIGLMAVLAIVTVVITGSVVQSLGLTSATRASVQSTAAAESGINYARAQLSAGTVADVCSPVITAPPGLGTDFTVSVSYSPDLAGDTFIDGCPGANPVQRLKLTSVGTAAASGVAGVSSGDEQAVEAIFAVTQSSGPITGSGAAIYAFSSGGFGNTGQLVSVDGSEATVHIKTGDVSCDNSAGVPDGFVVQNGGIEVNNTCNITGDLWARDYVRISNSVVVGGNVYGSSLRMSNTSRVLGTAWILGHSELRNSSKVMGLLTTKTIDASASATPGGRDVRNPNTPESKTMPTVADWVDFGYNMADWPGYTEYVLSNCSAAGLQIAVDALAGGPGVINALGCSEVSLSNTFELKLKNDVAIFGTRFSFNNQAKITTPVDRRLWLISPDPVADGVPTTTNCGPLSINNSFSFTPTVKVMVYTPCRVEFNNSISMYGQVFSGTASLNNSTTMYFVPVGLPGVDLATGGEATAPTGPPAGQLGALQAIRDTSVGG